MKPDKQISANDEARRCRELDATLATPTERAFALDLARAFDELAKERRLGTSEDAKALCKYNSL